jgi:hypothetical protein
MIFGCAALNKRPEKTLPRKRVIISCQYTRQSSAASETLMQLSAIASAAPRVTGGHIPNKKPLGPLFRPSTRYSYRSASAGFTFAALQLG